MSNSTATSDTYRVELYLRGDTYGTYEAQERVLERLQELDEEGALEMVGCDEWQAIQTREYEHREGALATYEEFQDWARHNDARLEPAFQQRMHTGLDRTEVTPIIVFPVISLAVYEAESLQAVFPCGTEKEQYTVQDCLVAFESGNGNRFLAQFAPREVSRTAPHLEEVPA
jgi:hypothetical protein